ncbi:MAG TPA: glycosyltransferase family 2 protein [Candidatus Limnocylindria bacterium]
MTLTVIIPTRDRAAQLRGAIRSVLASPLVRSPGDIIVVDDGSRDETPAVVAELGVRYVAVSSGGPSGSRNAGLHLADTEFIAFLDDDDEWLPGNMEQQRARLQGDPASAFAFGRVQRTDPDLKPFGEAIPLGPLPSGQVLEFVSYFDLQVGAILFRRAALEALGGFDTNLRFNEDSDLLVRLAARYPAVGVDTVGSLFRQRAPNASDAASRWPAHEARRAATRKWRRSGIRIPLRSRLRSDLNYRGMTSFFFCEDAAMALTAGKKDEAVTALIRGLRVSPLHCLFGHRRCWSVLALLGRSVLPR